MGEFRFAIESTIDLPCVGDWVCVQRHGSVGPAIIHSVVPRKMFPRRKCPGNTVDFQMIEANIDVAFIVQACGCDFNLARRDRYRVMANEGAIEPWILRIWERLREEGFTGGCTAVKDAVRSLTHRGQEALLPQASPTAISALGEAGPLRNETNGER